MLLTSLYKLTYKIAVTNKFNYKTNMSARVEYAFASYNDFCEVSKKKNKIKEEKFIKFCLLVSLKQLNMAHYYVS